MNKTFLSSAVVLDIGFAGYGIIRSLVKYKIPIIGFKSKGFYIEGGTRLCDKILVFKDLQHLYRLLIDYAKTQTQKPVLYLTSDLYVNFILENITEIKQYYQFDFPDENVMSQLMDKHKFANFAIKNSLKIPKTINLCNISEIDTIKGRLDFPVILKPWLRTDKWNKILKDKAYICSSFDNLKNIFNKVKLLERNLLIQEYIPGSDDHIYYCLAYYDAQSNCLAVFTGQKLSQWPVRTGSTATTIACVNDTIKNDLLKIFGLLNYKGFGSIEYKKHSTTGEYYITEPTVGRLNQQEFIATLNGTNIPLIAYNSLTGCGIKPIEPASKPTIYIDEKSEIQSVVKLLKEGNFSFKNWLSGIKGKRVYRFLNLMDPGVGLYLTIVPFLYIIKRIKG